MYRMKQGEFCWIDLVAKDMDAQTMFYEGLFGWTHQDTPDDRGSIYRTFKLEGKTVAGAAPIVPDMDAAGVPSMWNTYVCVADADAVVAKALELGGQIAMPAMDVMGQGRLAAIMDPTGAAFFLWQPMAHKGAEVFMENGALSWNDLTTRDPEKAKAFYRDLFGWEIEELTGGPGKYWQIKIDGVGEGGIMPMPDDMPAEMPPNWLVYFGAEDVAASTEKAKQLGATVVQGLTEIPGMLIFSIVADPKAAVFALLKGLTPTM